MQTLKFLLKNDWISIFIFTIYFIRNSCSTGGAIALAFFCKKASHLLKASSQDCAKNPQVNYPNVNYAVCEYLYLCLLCFFLPTIHLQGVRLEELLVSVGMAGVVSHVSRGHLGDVQTSLIAKILWNIQMDLIDILEMWCLKNETKKPKTNKLQKWNEHASSEDCHSTRISIKQIRLIGCIKKKSHRHWVHQEIKENDTDTESDTENS